MNSKKPANKAEFEKMIECIYSSLKEKGYDPASQIAGYILSEDPLYMPDWKNARGLIRHIDRDELLRLVIEYYFENRFDKTEAKDEKHE